ncbi:hypothetical protein J4221_03770 [Candidatus Pacearchaeota archaeon]|nr:hypothetical protein [Candidatus Pacearchaeota archaeon]
MKQRKKRKNKPTKKIIAMILAIVMILAILLISNKLTGKIVGFSDLFSKNKKTSEYVQVNKENLGNYLSRLSITHELPDDAEIELLIYNFDKGYREIEDTYVITKGNVYKGKAEVPDIVVLLHSKYINNLGYLCSTLQEANRNGDLGIELKKSSTSLLWKYKSIIKYKDCLGL